MNGNQFVANNVERLRKSFSSDDEQKDSGTTHVSKLIISRQERRLLKKGKYTTPELVTEIEDEKPRKTSALQDVTENKATDPSNYVGFANLPNQVHRKSVKKGFEFTLMVVGESGLGKSTLVDSLFLTSLYDNRVDPSAAERIKRTVGVTANTIDIEEKGVRLRLTVVDTPGFGDALNSNKSWDTIVNYVNQQFDAYFTDESGLNRRNIVDKRVHCCLYFINPVGHGLKPLDVVVMKALHDKVNIVPVIAKADTLTKKEVKNLKERVLKEINNSKIQIYQFPEADEEDDDIDFIEINKELKAAIPFAVIGSNHVFEANGRKVRGRTYPWGVVDIENPNHCDFTMLRNMLIRTHMQDLKDVTQEIHYENFRAQKLAGGKFNPAKMLKTEDRKKRQSGIQDERDLMLMEKEAELRKMKEMLAKMQKEMTEKQDSQGIIPALCTSSAVDGLSTVIRRIIYTDPDCCRRLLKTVADAYFIVRVFGISVLGSTTYTAIICEHKPAQPVACPAGSEQFMNITYASYGRLSNAHCPIQQNVTDCAANSSLDIVRRKCHGLNRCVLEATSLVFGDPCLNVLKYLEVRYTCVSGDRFPAMKNLRASYIYADSTPGSYASTIRFNSTTFVTRPYNISLFRITPLQTMSGNAAIYDDALAFLASSAHETVPTRPTNEHCLPNINDFSSKFCIYSSSGYLYTMQTFIPATNVNKSYRLSLVMRDSSSPVPVVRRANLTVTVVPQCFPMPDLYQAMKSNCPVHETVKWVYPVGVPWSGALYGRSIPISVTSPTTIVKIFINVDLLANFYASTNEARYRITLRSSSAVHTVEFKYTRTTWSEIPPSSGTPHVTGTQLNITLFPLGLVYRPIDITTVSSASPSYVNVTLDLISPSVRTNIQFNSENAVALHGTKRITVCPSSRCWRAYKAWELGIHMLRFTSKDSCIMDDHFQEAYFKPCNSSFKYGSASLPPTAPGNSIVYDIKNSIDFGTLNPTFFRVINYTVQNTSYSGYSLKYFCWETPFPEYERQYICVNRNRGLIRVRNNNKANLESFARLPDGYRFVLEIQAEGKVSGVMHYRICSIAVTIWNRTATTVFSSTRQATPTIASKTTAVPIAEFCKLVKSCTQKYHVLHPTTPTSNMLIYGLDKVLSTTRFRLWSVNIGFAIPQILVRLELYGLDGLHRVPMPTTSPQLLSNQTNNVTLDLPVPQNCDRIGLLVYNVSSNATIQLVPHGSVTISLATFDFCDVNHCIELHKSFNKLYNGSFCPNKPFSRYSVCLETSLQMVPQLPMYLQPVRLTCQSQFLQPSQITWYKDGAIMQSQHGAVLSLTGTTYEQQGYYTCVTRDSRSNAYPSRRILVKFSDVFTSKIYLEITNKRYTVNLEDKTSQSFKELSSQLVQSVSKILTTLPLRAHTISVERFSGPSIVLATLKMLSNVPQQTKIEEFYSDMKKLLVTAANDDGFDTLKVFNDTIIVLNHEYCLPETTHEDRSKGPYHWPLTRSKRSASVGCTSGPVGMHARRVCTGNFTVAAFWQHVTDANCAYNSKTTQKLDDLSKVAVNSTNAALVSKELGELTANSSTFTSDDTVLASQTFSSIAALNTTTIEIVDGLLLTASNLLQVNESALIASQSQQKALTIIVKGIESLADKLPLPNITGQTVVRVSSGVAIQAVQIDSQFSSALTFALTQLTFNNSNVISNQKYQPNGVAIGISIPNTILSDIQSKSASRLSFIAYKGAQFFQSLRSDALGNRLRNPAGAPNSMIIAAHVPGQQQVNLSQPLNGTFQKKNNQPSTSRCVFWDFDADDGFGAWSSRGCRQIVDQHNRVTCQCDHMTNFAILFDVYAGKQNSIDAKHEKILGIISFIGIGLSLGGLLITLVTLLLFSCVVTGWAAYGALFAPICLALLVNFIGFGMVFHSLQISANAKGKTKDQRRNGISQLRIAAAFSCILGLTWVFGIFAIADARIAFQYLFCIFNSLQGFTVFFLHVARHQDARNHWKHFISGKGLNYYRSSLLSTSRDRTLRPSTATLPKDENLNLNKYSTGEFNGDAMTLEKMNPRLNSTSTIVSNISEA
eukprot:gene14269-15756_t